MIVRSLWKGEIEKHESPKEITERVAKKYGVTVEDLKGDSRRREFTIPRQEAMAEIYARCNVSTTWVGRYFNKLDHTTVLNAIKRVQERSVDKSNIAQSSIRREGANSFS